MNENIRKLNNEGWFINEFKLTEYIENNGVTLNGFNAVKQYLLNTDIKSYGETWMNISNKNELDCCGVLQISKIRNVSMPEIEQDNRGSGGLYKYTVTDGVTTTQLLDLQTASQLSKGVDVGSKILLKGHVTFKHGMLLVTEAASMLCLGGKVLELLRADSVHKSSKGVRYAVGGKSAPKFIPFGNKLDINIQEIKQFRAMKSDQKDDIDETQNTEFGEKRQAALAEVRKVKTSDSTVVTDKNSLLDKFHGGATSKFIKSTTEKQDQADADLSFLMTHGFNFTDSKRALQSSNNDAKTALDVLLKSRTESQLNVSSDRGRGGRGRRGGGSGGGRNRRNHSDPDGDDTWFDPAQFAERVGLASRPTTTTSLAEMMGGKSGSESRNTKENNYFNCNMIKRGFECLAQVMDGSYQPAIVVEVMPNKCVKIRYPSTGEMIETTASCLKTVNGEKILEHMIPIVDEPLSHYNSRTTGSATYNSVDYRNDSGYRGRARGRGRPNTRSGGRYNHGY